MVYIKNTRFLPLLPYSPCYSSDSLVYCRLWKPKLCKSSASSDHTQDATTGVLNLRTRALRALFEVMSYWIDGNLQFVCLQQSRWARRLFGHVVGNLSKPPNSLVAFDEPTSSIFHGTFRTPSLLWRLMFPETQSSVNQSAEQWFAKENTQAQQFSFGSLARR